MRAVELFCGAGGMSRGLIDAGFDVMRAYDAWPVAVDTYRHNLGNHVEEADLGNLSAVVPKVMALAPDIIVGGPPCQDYSTAGKREEGKNASLTVAYAIVVATVKPEWFLMENVLPALKSEAWREAKSILIHAGYGMSETKVDCSHYGVAQRRKRLLVIGRRGERPGFIESAVHNARSERPITVKDLLRSGSHLGTDFLLGPKPRWDNFQFLVNGFAYSRPYTGGRGVRSIEDPLPTVTRTSLEKPAKKYRSNPHPADPVPADQAWKPTLRQIQQIQGFPRSWEWPFGTDKDKMQMVANGVPAPAAKIIGQVILARHRGETAPEIEGAFRGWLIRGNRSRRTVNNIRSNLARARRMLGGRTYADPLEEVAALEATPGFDALKPVTKSDLRQALRLYSKYLDTKASKRTKNKSALTAEDPGPIPPIDLAAMIRGMTSVAHKYHSEIGLFPGEVSRRGT
ncbi:DNA cytosine methyltransferase [Sinorhizobium meliloti]|uniref:DNA cytosine methyltransferase n=1 Tax=Rhizobium meliloti TaxID=382 RepID=UPI001F19A55C|nr:DNA (cytosine-5-)-methyltransferase [Sinorhizobium meliloti]